MTGCIVFDIEVRGQVSNTFLGTSMKLFKAFQIRNDHNTRILFAHVLINKLET